MHTKLLCFAYVWHWKCFSFEKIEKKTGMNRHQHVFSFPAKFSSLGLMPPPLPPAPPAMVNVSIPMSAPAFPPQVAMMPTHMHIQALSAEEQKMQQQQEQQQTVKKSSSEEEGELTPRGNHRYPKRKPWKPYRIAAWLALILAFTTVVIVVIVWGFRVSFRITEMTPALIFLISLRTQMATSVGGCDRSTLSICRRCSQRCAMK